MTTRTRCARTTTRARSRVDGRARRRCVARGTRRDEDGTPTRVCVVGGGFAGASLAFHVIEEANARGRAIDVTLMDAVGVAGGASGVAAGLLHPYTPRGKTVWRGDEGVREAKRMIDAAQRAADVARRVGFAVDHPQQVERGGIDGRGIASVLGRAVQQQARNRLPDQQRHRDGKQALAQQAFREEARQLFQPGTRVTSAAKR